MVADRNAKRAGGARGASESEPGEPAFAHRLRSWRAASNPNFLTLAAAHAANGLSRAVTRRAVRSGKLAGFIPAAAPELPAPGRRRFAAEIADVARTRGLPRLATLATPSDQTESVGESEIPGGAEMRRTGDRLPEFGAPGAITAGADLIVPISAGKPCGPWLAEIKSPDRSVCATAIPKADDLTMTDPSEIVPPLAIVWRPARQTHEGSLWHARRWPEINALGALGNVMRDMVGTAHTRVRLSRKPSCWPPRTVWAWPCACPVRSRATVCAWNQRPP